MKNTPVTKLIETQYAGRLTARDSLSPVVRQAMFNLLTSHFSGVEPDAFNADLAEKNWVLTIEDPKGRLVGFSTLLVYESSLDGQAVLVVYSGDTIMDPGAWNSTAMARHWIAAVQTLQKTRPGLRCFWLLLTSGFRSYRLLSTFWKNFYPAPGSDASHELAGLRNKLAREKFGGRFCPDTGIVRLDHPQMLRAHLAHVPDSRMSNRHVAYFLEQNPGHARGDELACICEIAEHNLTRAGRRMVGLAAHAEPAHAEPGHAELAHVEPAHEKAAP